MDGGDERERELSLQSIENQWGADSAQLGMEADLWRLSEELESALLCAEWRAAGVCTAVRGAACGGRAIALLIVSSALR